MTVGTSTPVVASATSAIATGVPPKSSAPPVDDAATVNSSPASKIEA